MSRETNLLRAQLLIEAADLLDEGFSNDVKRDGEAEFLHSKSPELRKNAKDNNYGAPRYRTAEQYRKYHKDDMNGTSVKDIDDKEIGKPSKEEIDEFKREYGIRPNRVMQKIYGGKSGKKMSNFYNSHKDLYDEIL